MAVSPSKVAPFTFNVPIVDPRTGRPSEQFARQLQQLVTEKQAVAGVANAALPTSSLLTQLLTAAGGDPGADALLWWDHTNNTFHLLKIGSGLSIAAGVLNASGGGSGAGMTVIQEYVADGTTGTHTFSAIPNTYKDLLLRVTGRSTAAAIGSVVNITVNGLTTAIYDIQRQYALSGTPSADQSLGGTNWGAGSLNAIVLPAASSAAGDISGGEMIIHAYAQTIFNKLMQGKARQPDSGTTHDGYLINFNGQARTTAAIASLTATLASGNFVAGSQLCLYGIG